MIFFESSSDDMTGQCIFQRLFSSWETFSDGARKFGFHGSTDRYRFGV